MKRQNATTTPYHHSLAMRRETNVKNSKSLKDCETQSRPVVLVPKTPSLSPWRSATYRRGSFPKSDGMDDRFIPNRKNMNLELCRRSIFSAQSSKTTPGATAADENIIVRRQFNRYMLSSLCNVPLESINSESAHLDRILSFGSTEVRSQEQEDPLRHAILRTMTAADFCSQPTTAPRSQLGSRPYAWYYVPSIIPDLNSNIVSWGKSGLVAIAMGASVWMLNPSNWALKRIVSIDTLQRGGAKITSIKWCNIQKYNHFLVIGTSQGTLYMADTNTMQCLATYSMDRKVCLYSTEWNSRRGFLSCGDSRGKVHHVDFRTRNKSFAISSEHKSSVSALAWDKDGDCLASGGNDNLICLWDSKISGRSRPDRSFPPLPRATFNQHKAAVKALDWSSFRRGVLASGGGLRDQSIKVWDTNSASLKKSVDADSLVSSIFWSRTSLSDLYSSHGYGDSNVVSWNYRQQTTTLIRTKQVNFHANPIFSMDMSPDGLSLVTVSTDETLAFWDLGRPVREAVPLFGGYTIR